MVKAVERLEIGFAELEEILALAVDEQDHELLDEATTELASYQGDLEKLEFQRMFSGQMDANCAYLDVQSGSGGTEAQDWAEMLLRMCLRWGEA